MYLFIFNVFIVYHIIHIKLKSDHNLVYIKPMLNFILLLAFELPSCFYGGWKYSSYSYLEIYIFNNCHL